MFPGVTRVTCYTTEPTRLERLLNDLGKLRRSFDRLAAQGKLQRKHDKHDAIQLARRGFVYRDGKNWSRRIEALAAPPPALATAVGRLPCFRGLQRHGAMVLATQIGDWRRFARPTQLMADLGFVSRENSTGERERKGSITKAGNSYCRHVLVQAAWSYRHRLQVGTHLKGRQESQPAAVITHAWKAQHRLHKLYRHLAYRKQPCIAAVAQLHHDLTQRHLTSAQSYPLLRWAATPWMSKQDWRSFHPCCSNTSRTLRIRSATE